jgi:hypothetical protein
VSVLDEQDLRERLGGLLASIEPLPAPVLIAVRQGSRIRTRRWMSAAAGLAVLAGGAGTLTAVVHPIRPAPPVTPQAWYSVTVHPPGQDAPAGLIAYGTQDGQPWQLAIAGRGANLSITATGGANPVVPALSATAPVVTSSASDGPAGANGTTIVGAVTSSVTAVAVTLPGDKVLTLRPVRYRGHRYVGVVLPYAVPVVRAVAYQGRRELAYSVPYEKVALVNWWRPGQAGPPGLTRTVAAGVMNGKSWRYVAQFGPWGYCYAGPEGSSCGEQLSGDLPSPGNVTWMMSAHGVDGAGQWATGLARAGAGVRRVRLRLSGGGVDTITPVEVAGARLFGYAVPAGQRVVHLTTYDASGRVLVSSSGAGLNYPG